MHPSCLRRLAHTCRVSVMPIVCSVLLLAGARAAAAATLTGRVTGPDGRGVAEARVILSTVVGTAVESATDDRGGFELRQLAGGRYELRVVVDGFQADPVDVTVGPDETRAIDVPLRLSAIAESIVVSASQIDVPLSRAADSVTVITAADLQARQIETVAEALRFVPGMTVNRSGGRGAITSLFPRGGASNYTLVLIDGIRVNSFGGGYDFANLSIADVDRIEIVRGPQSALFGSDAIGAVVQVVTRRGGRFRATGLVEGGTQATARLAVGAAGSRGEWSFGGGAEQTRSDGFSGVAPATGETVANDDYHLTHGSGSIGWHRQNGPDFLLTANIVHHKRGFPGPFGSNPIGVFAGVDRISRGVNETRQVGSRFGHAWSTRVRQRVEANYTNIAGDFISPFGTSSSGTKRFDARVQEDIALSRLFGASAGVEFIGERGSSTFITGPTSEPIPVKRSVTGTFAELRYAGFDRLFVTGGVRLEHIVRDRVEPNFDIFSTRPAFPAQTVNSANPKIAMSYLVKQSGSPGTVTRLHASAGSGIRPPDAFEIAFTDNPSLKPERSRSVDAGVEHQFGGGAYAVGATAFVNNYDDLIITVGFSLRDASRYRSDNISNARARGLELSAHGRVLAALTLHASYTFLSTEILSVDGLSDVAPSPFKVGDALLRRPRHQGAFDATFAKGRITAFGELTSRAQVFDVEPNFGSFGGLFFTPGYTVVNAGGSIRLSRNVEAYARAQNLADRQYEETLGFPAARRTGIVGVRVAASR